MVVSIDGNPLVLFRPDHARPWTSVCVNVRRGRISLLQSLYVSFAVSEVPIDGNRRPRSHGFLGSGAVKRRV